MANVGAKTGLAPERDPVAAAARADRYDAIERALRLWSGLVLFVFVLTHLLNHAVGVLGVDAMEAAQTWRVYVWRTWAGTALLYGSAVVHILLVSKRIIARRTWRMPIQEALQIALGLAIPLLLYEHAIGTRYVSTFAGVDDRYAATLLHLYPGKFLLQTLLVLVVWFHGVIGLHYALRVRPWYVRWREALLVLAVLIPVLAIAGFVSGAREALEFNVAAANWNAEQRAAFIEASRWANWALLVFAGGLTVGIGGLAAARRLGSRVPVRYRGHGLIQLPRGSTLLEASRNAGIPHPSLCGGRGRCSTCRVLIKEGIEDLPPPGAVEAQMLKRISAPPRVRLSCQIRPKAPLKVQILLPLTSDGSNPELSDDGLAMGTEREASVLFVDVRAFSKMLTTQLPYDVIVLLNRFIGEMRQAIEAHDGRVLSVQSDGLMAVFGLDGDRRAGSRSALLASRDMLRAVDAMNEELHAALAMPLRVGIGVHKGPVVLGGIGDEGRGFTITALGESVTIASRLEAATKRVLADCLVSEDVLTAAGRGIPTGERREVTVPGRAEPIVAYSVTRETEFQNTDAPEDDSEDDSETAAEGAAKATPQAHRKAPVTAAE
ncbi:MAG: adenylate/guanylate cyclase domain-containing protein [Pseudomonadota bacterium]